MSAAEWPEWLPSADDPDWTAHSGGVSHHANISIYDHGYVVAGAGRENRAWAIIPRAVAWRKRIEDACCMRKGTGDPAAVARLALELQEARR